MYFKRFYMMIAIVSVLTIAACGNTGESAEEEESSNEEGGSQETVTYENDFEISAPEGSEGESEEVQETKEIPKNPTVAIFDLGVATTMTELGLEEYVAGLPKGEGNSALSEQLSAFESDEYANLGGLKEPDYEAVAELQPEVIMLHGRQSTSDIVEELEAAAPDAEIIHVAADNNNYFEDIKSMTTFLGELYEVEGKAEELTAELDNRLEEVNSQVSDLDESMLFVQTNGGDISFHGQGGRYGFLYEDFGFTSAGEQDEEETTDNHGNQISYEFIAETNPGLILMMDRGAAVSSDDSTSADILSNDVTSNADAIENNNVYELDPAVWYLNAGGYGSAMAQLNEVEEAVQNAQQ